MSNNTYSIKCPFCAKDNEPYALFCVGSGRKLEGKQSSGVNV